MCINDLKQNENVKNEKEEPNHLNNGSDALESVLKHLGLGRYHLLLCLGMIPIGLCFSFIYFVQMFIAATPQRHWCNVPQLNHLDLELRRNLTAPTPNIEGEEWDHCFMYDANWTEVLLHNFTDPNTPIVGCKYGWEFELQDIPYQTVVSERGWVCENSGYMPLTQTIFFVGSFFGGLFYGWVVDYFGRVPALIGTNVFTSIGNIATIYTTGVWDLAFCRFLVGTSYDTCFMTMYILVLEYTSPKYRTWAANISFATFFGSGCLILPWLALWVSDWRKLLWVTSLPLLMAVIISFNLPESARYGRQMLTAVPLLGAGSLIVIAMFVPKGMRSLIKNFVDLENVQLLRKLETHLRMENTCMPQVILATMARFFINMAYSAAVQWSAEIMPTPVRGSASSFIHVMGYVSTFLSPFVVYSERIWKPLPLLIFGVLAIMASAVALMIPETKGQPMPQTIEEGERMVQNYTFIGKVKDIEENSDQNAKNKLFS